MSEQQSSKTVVRYDIVPGIDCVEFNADEKGEWVRWEEYESLEREYAYFRRLAAHDVEQLTQRAAVEPPACSRCDKVDDALAAAGFVGTDPCVGIRNLRALLDVARAAEPPDVARLAIDELKNIMNARRSDREYFADNTEFAEWAQSRARHTLGLIEAATVTKVDRCTCGAGGRTPASRPHDLTCPEREPSVETEAARCKQHVAAGQLCGLPLEPYAGCPVHDRPAQGTALSEEASQ
jgi:hypothetical protein